MYASIVGSEPPMSLPNDPNIEIYPLSTKQTPMTG